MRIEISDQTVKLVEAAVRKIEQVPWDQRDWSPATTALIAIHNVIRRATDERGEG